MLEFERNKDREHKIFFFCWVTEIILHHNPLGFFKKKKKRTSLFVFLEDQRKEWGAQWLSGRVLDSRPKGRGFEPHRRHCVVVLEQDTFILA